MVDSNAAEPARRYLAAVRVDFHLSKQDAAQSVPDQQQQGQELSAEPHGKCRADHDKGGSHTLAFVAPLGEGFVPRVSLIDDPGEPPINGPDHGRKAHRQSLPEMPQFVRNHSGQFKRTQSSHQGQPDGQHEVTSEDTGKSASETCRGVELAIHVDPGRHRRAHLAGDLLNEGVDYRLGDRIDRQGLRTTTGASQKGLHHENHSNDSGDQWSDIQRPADQQAIYPSRGSMEQESAVIRPPIGAVTRRTDHSNINNRQQNHQPRHDQQGSHIGRGGPGATNTPDKGLLYTCRRPLDIELLCRWANTRSGLRFNQEECVPTAVGAVDRGVGQLQRKLEMIAAVRTVAPGEFELTHASGD